jgi:6-phosphogluconate dehydrogenase
MQLGLVGLGRMGGNMRERLRRAGHEVVGYDRNQEISDATSLAAMVAALAPPRVVWVMVPAGVTESTVDELAGLLGAGDIVIDGGNSRFSDDGPRAERLAAGGVGYLDVGVSGGVWGLEAGYALMVGGTDEHVERCMPILTAADLVTNVPGVVKSWREGTVIRSWLLDLLDQALDADPTLAGLRGYADDTGEGRWTVEEAIRLAVPMNVIAASLFARFASRQDDSPAMKAVAALRAGFGGHAVKKG